MNTQFVWIKGPVLKPAGRPSAEGQVLNGRYYQVVWKDGFSGPYSMNEAVKKSASIPKSQIVHDDPFGDSSPVSTVSQELVNENVFLKAQVEILERKVSEMRPEGPSVEDTFNKDLDLATASEGVRGLEKANARKRLMKSVRFDTDEFDGYKEAWSHFSKYVLPYLK